jgi:hypothetical protein
MPAFGEKEKLSAPFADGIADRFLAALVALRCVDDVNAGVERAVQDLPDVFDVFARGARAAKTQYGHIHIRSAEAPLFHQSTLDTTE